jgi:hypothetical protein
LLAQQSTNSTNFAQTTYQRGKSWDALVIGGPGTAETVPQRLKCFVDPSTIFVTVERGLVALVASSRQTGELFHCCINKSDGQVFVGSRPVLIQVINTYLYISGDGLNATGSSSSQNRSMPTRMLLPSRYETAYWRK